MTSAGAGRPAAAGTAALANAMVVFRVPPPDPSYSCWAARSYTARGGPSTAIHGTGKWTPFPLPPLAAPSQRDPMLEGHVKVCGPEPHTSRVAAQVERAWRPHVDALWHWAEGLAGERAPGPGPPSLAVPPRGAFVCRRIRRAGGFGTARGSRRPTQESCARATRPRTRVGPLRSPLGEPVLTTVPMRRCGRPQKCAPRLLGATGGGVVWGGGLASTTSPSPASNPPPPLVYHHLPTGLAVTLAPPSLLFSSFFSFFLLFRSPRRSQDLPLDSSPP